MAGADKVIITCAVTGSIHTPTMSPHLPLTPDEIAEASIGAWEAGASIIHLHARDPRDGSPTPDPDVFMEFLPRIKQATDAVVNIAKTTPDETIVVFTDVAREDWAKAGVLASDS